jgi:hypothetical protein
LQVHDTSARTASYRSSSGASKLELTEESGLLLLGLESTVTEVGRSVDELEVDLLEVSPRGVNHEGLSEGEDTLLSSGDASLEDEEVVLDETVVGPSSERVLEKRVRKEKISTRMRNRDQGKGGNERCPSR